MNPALWNPSQNWLRQLAQHGHKPARGVVCLALLVLAARPAAAQQESFRQANASGSCNVLVIGYVGGVGTVRIPPTVAVPILHHLKSLGYPGLCIRLVSPYCLGCGARWVKKHFSAGGKGPLTPRQIELGPKVISFGYSLGVPSELRAARVLERAGIPIELLVAVDSKGFTKGIIPNNVRQAANFYERELFPLYFGKKDLRPEDPAKTNFMGNIHLASVGHFSIVRSSAVRDLLVTTVRRLSESEAKEVRSGPLD